MTLALADWHDILQVLHETYRIWAPGLNREQYQQYIWEQMSHRWARKNYRFLVYRRGDAIAASCKLYDLVMTARGKEYHVGGIGAVFTQESCRGKGCGTDLIHALIDMTQDEGYDGLILYSEIGPEFYHQFGFEELGAADFCIFLPDSSSPAESGQSAAPKAWALRNNGNLDGIAWLARHYTRWLRNQPYGIARSEDYWHYKLSREAFLHRNSKLCWPSLSISRTEDAEQEGYMITEQGGGTLRVLEVVGCEQGRTRLWQQLLLYAKDNGIRRIRGWESGVRDLAPCFSLAPYLQEAMFHDKLAPVRYTERDWGRGMLLPFNEDLHQWKEHFPCPLLELDHI